MRGPDLRSGALGADRSRVRNSYFLSLGVLLATGLGIGAFQLRGQGAGDAVAWLRQAVAGREEPVWVILVADRAGVAAVRAAIEPERIVAASADALALREGRVVATSPEAAGEPITAAGWLRRPIELWALRPERRARPAAGHGQDEDEAALTLARLAKKETLTPGEALLALQLVAP